MPSWELFQRRPADDRAAVLPVGVPRVSVEAATTFGWERWIGDGGRAIGIDRFGASAPAPVLFEQFGFTAEAVAQAARDVLGR
jgi:transketolase